MPLNVAVQMDHDRDDQHRRRFDLRADARRRSGAATRSSTTRPTAWRCATGASAPRVEPVTVRDEKGNHFTLGPARARRPRHVRRGAAAPGSALRHGLHHHHPSARAHPPEDAGGQRPGRGAQRAGKALRHRVSRSDAADADHPRPERDARTSARSTATSSSSRSTAMAAPASSASPAATRISARCSRCSPPTFREPFIVQRYLPEVRKGDKRIILVDGEPVGAINRVPARGRGALQHACRRPRRSRPS